MHIEALAKARLRESQGDGRGAPVRAQAAEIYEADAYCPDVSATARKAKALGGAAVTAVDQVMVRVGVQDLRPSCVAVMADPHASKKERLSFFRFWKELSRFGGQTLVQEAPGGFEPPNEGFAAIWSILRRPSFVNPPITTENLPQKLS